MKRVAFYTLGCKVNQYETEAMTQLFIDGGFTLVDFESAADVYVVNTCTVTSISDRKSRQMLRRARRRNPLAVVVAVGCYAQISPEALAELDVNLILGASARKNIVEYAAHAQAGRHIIINPSVTAFEPLEISSYSERTRALVKVQDGCENFCSYCIIPFARGVPRSRLPANALDEARRLTQNGFRELVLTGVNLSCYGKDLDGSSLIDLVELIHALPGLVRLRLGSLNPISFTRDFVKRLSSLPKVCEHFHISLQSGCDAILERMSRRYSTADYARAVDLVREFFPRAGITTDIITGFPGEGAQDFETTCRFARDIGFDNIHVFPYSERTGTQAAVMDGIVPRAEREERARLLTSIAKELRIAALSKMSGCDAEVLLEQYENGVYTGFTRNYLPVRHTDVDGLTGDIKSIQITRVDKDALVLCTC